MQLHDSEPFEFYNSMNNAGKWDEIAYEEYISSSDKYLRISKPTHHSTNKKPHECEA